MKPVRWKKALYVVGAIAALGLVVFVLLPDPLLVDAGEVTAGPMEVTVDDQGETRSHDRFVVAAPFSGRLMRIELHDGDPVTRNQILAQIAPLPQSAREREEQRARIAAAEALLSEAAEHVRHAADDLALAKTERERTERLVQNGGVPVREGERARNLEITAGNELDAARFRAASAKAQVEVARSGLVTTRPDGSSSEEVVEIRSPVAGRVLRVGDPSERVVAAGTPLLTLGNLDKLEVVVELLSTEAVKIQSGMPVRLEGYGDNRPIRARIRLVEPFAFTKVSALGVEEKRTNVIADFVDPPGSLGDGFRVTARIIVWQSERVTKVPASALFRCDDSWCAFAIERGRAVQRKVDVGHRNAREAEVLGGLRVGENVIGHPQNDLAEGSRVRIRPRVAR